MYLLNEDKILHAVELLRLDINENTKALNKLEHLIHEKKESPAMIELKANIKTNRNTVRKTAPIIVSSKSLLTLL